MMELLSQIVVLFLLLGIFRLMLNQVSKVVGVSDTICLWFFVDPDDLSLVLGLEFPSLLLCLSITTNLYELLAKVKRFGISFGCSKPLRTTLFILYS